MTGQKSGWHDQPGLKRAGFRSVLSQEACLAQGHLTNTCVGQAVCMQEHHRIQPHDSSCLSVTEQQAFQIPLDIEVNVHWSIRCQGHPFLKLFLNFPCGYGILRQTGLA